MILSSHFSHLVKELILLQMLVLRFTYNKHQKTTGKHFEEMAVTFRFPFWS